MLSGKYYLFASIFYLVLGNFILVNENKCGGFQSLDINLILYNIIIVYHH